MSTATTSQSGPAAARRALMCIVSMASLLLCASVAAALRSPDDQSAPRKSGQAMSQGDYLGALSALRRAALGSGGDVDDWAAFSVWSQYLPFVLGELPEGFFDNYRNREPVDAAWLPQIRNARSADAIAEIVKRARQTRVVVLNEAHYSPRDRAFAFAVTKALRPLGYSNLALETLDNEEPHSATASAAARLNDDRVVRFDTGRYTADPVFASFVTQSLGLGYRVIAYEATEAQRESDQTSDGRERAQARNLIDAAMRPGTTAKTLVYVGFSHVYEAPIGPQKFLYLAGRIKRETGIDPLTVDQTTLSEELPSTRNAYLLASARIGRRPAILMTNGAPLLLALPGAGTAGVDLQIVHPPRAYSRGRPRWLSSLPGTWRPVPTALLPRRGRRLVQAFGMEAPSDAVPLDQVVVVSDQPAPYMHLRDQHVRFAAHNIVDEISVAGK